ncbi:MAG TPA: DUF438 domain-containing protein [Candidatus Deferrimicrobium sp.]|nr:DUF438 domain-containing protein [Candidatus Deferrimicrobium sp.]
MYKPTTKLSVVLTEHPRAAAYLASINPQLKLLGNPVVIGLMAPCTDLRKVAERAGWTVEELEAAIVRSDTEGTAPATSGEAPAKIKEDLKAVLRKLYAGEDPVTCKAQFKELIAKADPLLIATAEAELAREGFSTDQLMEACDVHMDVFRDQLASSRTVVPDGHPLKLFIREQDAIIAWLEQGFTLARTLSALDGYVAAESTLAELRALMQHLHEAQSHDARQENTLFPLLERYGVEEPPTIMWAEHNRMKATRDIIDKTIRGTPDAMPYAQFAQVLAGAFQHWLETFVQHAKKEQEILYNVALDLLSEKDWQDLQQESQELGFFALPGDENR